MLADHPRLLACLSGITRFWVRILGWRIVGERPNIPKYVLMGAPHTSNWDFLIFLGIFLGWQLPAVWLVKHTVFRWPLKGLLRWLGAVPVDRRAAHGIVHQVVSIFSKRSQVALVIAPEGTRKQVAWKSGFYHMARGANVPIALGFIDRKRKEVGIFKVFYPTGDFEADMAEIRKPYEERF